VISRLLIALTLMGICVAIHAAGMSWALRQLRNRRPETPRFWPVTRRFILVAAWIILLHLAEITVWAGF
jgi:hypothetical protein